MHEKLIENWLTSANELSYQLPFCEVLIAEGHSIIHVSSHGRGEHGKDVVSRAPDGRLCTYQLKGGDIALPAWRSIRGEVEELVQLPVRFPGVSEGEPHVPHLVTNGEIKGDAIEDIKRYADLWHTKGAPELVVVSRRELLVRFLLAGDSVFPSALVDFRRFVELYVADFEDRLPREQFGTLMESAAEMIDPSAKPLQVRRLLAGIVVVAGYIAEQYVRADNHVSAAEAWTMAAATVLRVAEQRGLQAAEYQPVLDLIGIALDRSLDRFLEEVIKRRDLFVGVMGEVDPFVYGTRALLVLGWIAASAHRKELLGQDAIAARDLEKIVRRESRGMRTAGEVDWPSFLLLSLLLERRFGASQGERLIEMWVSQVLRANQRGNAGLPNPYWLPEKVVRQANGLLPPSEHETFRGHVYTLAGALDMMVRRCRRQFVQSVWPSASRLLWCEFELDDAADLFLWHCKRGTLRTEGPALRASWSEWRTSTETVESRQIPDALLRHPEWLPPFIMTYPHRATRLVTGLTDAVIGKRSRLSGVPLGF